MTYILKRRIIYHAKKSFKFLNLFFLLLISIVSVIAFKYKPVYKVTIAGQTVGYVTDKVELETRINNEILAHTGNVAFVTIKQFPEYKLEYVNRNEQTNENEIINSLKQNAEITYRYYAVTFNNENKAFVNTLEEAEQIVADIKNEHNGNLELNIENLFDKEYNKIKNWKKTFHENRGNKFISIDRLPLEKIIEELNNSNYMIRSMGERMALNTPIQGSSADILKIAMIDIDKKFRELGIKSKMILQIHDELVFDCLDTEKENVSKIVKEVMENVVKLKVPLVVDINTGNNLYEAK